jgi:hypothetical protein
MTEPEHKDDVCEALVMLLKSYNYPNQTLMKMAKAGKIWMEKWQDFVTDATNNHNSRLCSAIINILQNNSDIETKDVEAMARAGNIWDDFKRELVTIRGVFIKDDSDSDSAYEASTPKRRKRRADEYPMEMLASDDEFETMNDDRDGLSAELESIVTGNQGGQWSTRVPTKFHPTSHPPNPNQSSATNKSTRIIRATLLSPSMPDIPNHLFAPPSSLEILPTPKAPSHQPTTTNLPIHLPRSLRRIGDGSSWSASTQRRLAQQRLTIDLILQPQILRNKVQH